jgi:hypothetical protein
MGMKKRIGLLCILVFGTAATTRAEPPAGVTPTLIGRATYGAFNLQADPLA